VNAGKFLMALKSAGFAGALAVEREAGNNRLSDVQTAVNTLRQFVCE
jgi:sugar phosphate isomerase/epimerase